MRNGRGEFAVCPELKVRECFVHVPNNESGSLVLVCRGSMAAIEEGWNQ